MWLHVAGHAPPSPVQFRWSAHHPPPRLLWWSDWTVVMEKKKWPANKWQNFRESLSTLLRFRCEDLNRKSVTGPEMWFGWKQEPRPSLGVLGTSGGLPYEHQRRTERYPLPDWKCAPCLYSAFSWTHPLFNSFPAQVSNPKVCGVQKTPLGVGEVYVLSDRTQLGPGSVALRHSVASKELVGSELDSCTIPDTECDTATSQFCSNPCFDVR